MAAPPWALLFLSSRERGQGRGLKGREGFRVESQKNQGQRKGYWETRGRESAVDTKGNWPPPTPSVLPAPWGLWDQSQMAPGVQAPGRLQSCHTSKLGSLGWNPGSLGGESRQMALRTMTTGLSDPARGVWSWLPGPQ